MQFLARLEADRLARRNADFSAGTRVAANAGFAGAYAEYAKPAQFNALTGSKGLFKAFEYRVYSGFRLGAGKSRALDYVMHDVLFNQRSTSLT